LEVRRRFRSRKGKGKNYEKGGKPELAKGGKPEFAKGGKPEFAKGGKDDKGGKNATKGEFKGEFKGEKGDKGNKGPKGPTLPVPKASGSKCARISEEPAEVVEANSNKMHDNGAMTDGSKRRHEAVESNLDAESVSSVIGSFSFISDTGDSPPLFPAVFGYTGIFATHLQLVASSCAKSSLEVGQMTAFYAYMWHASLLDTSLDFGCVWMGNAAKGVWKYTLPHMDCMCYVSGCNLHGGYNRTFNGLLGRALKLMQNGLRTTGIGYNAVKMRFMCM